MLLGNMYFSDKTKKYRVVTQNSEKWLHLGGYNQENGQQIHKGSLQTNTHKHIYNIKYIIHNMFADELKQ